MISINPYEIILQIINFGILYFITEEVFGSAIIKLLSKQSNLIKHNIETSEMNKKKSEDILAQQKDTLKQAQLEAQSIRNKAEESAQNELASVVEKGKQSAEQMLAQAKQDIDVQTNNARKTLLKDVADLAVKVVQKFVVTEVSEKDKKATIDKLVEQVADK